MLLWTSVQPFYAVPSAESLSRASAEGYRSIWSDGSVVRALWNTIQLALATSIATIVLAVLVGWFVVRRRQTVPGQAFLAVVLGYSVCRYVIEIFRADLDRGNVGPFSASQFIAIATFVAAALFLWMRGRSRTMRSTPGVTV